MIPQPTHQFKLVLVGQSSVGKSSILTRFVDDHFSQSLLSTIGVDFKFRSQITDLGYCRYFILLYDIGQETFRSIVSAYYNSSDAIIVVYDITSYRSIQCVKEYWLGQAHQNNKNNACVFLIGNKLDEGQTKREVQSFTIESVMETHQVDKHFQVSAKTGENIQATFVQICKTLINKKKGLANSSKEIKNVSITPNTANKTVGEPTKLEGTNQSTFQPKNCCSK